MSSLADELSAARAYGLPPNAYFALDREERAMITGHFILLRWMDALSDYDNWHKDKR